MQELVIKNATQRVEDKRTKESWPVDTGVCILDCFKYRGLETVAVEAADDRQ